MPQKKKGRTGTKKTLLELLELPEEILLNLTKVTAIGAGYIGIENHRGIIKYEPEVVRLKTNPGEMEISGEELRIRNISSDEIIVEGKILNLNFKR